MRLVARTRRSAVALALAAVTGLAAWMFFPSLADAADTGSITRELWTGVPGAGIADIPLASPPSSTITITQFETPENAGEHYGQRIRGYLVPPATGSYTFWIAGDDNVQLWLSTDASAANKRMVAYHTNWTSFREWNKFPTQKSAPVSLTANTRYYVEALHKEGEVGDSLSVGWLRPGQSGTVPSEIIPGSALAPLDATGGCQSPVANVRVPAGQSIQQAVNANPAGTSFVLGAGVHRLASVEPKQGNRFYGELAPDCTRLTVMNGAKVLTGWARSGPRWSVTGQDQGGQVHGECANGWARCAYPGWTQIYATNAFSNNVYHASNRDDRHFAWANTDMTFAEFQAAGQDTGGRLDTTVTAQTWTCL